MPEPTAGGVAWRPAASIERLRRRAEVLRAIRAFFEARGVWEVETPVLVAAGSTDPQIQNLSTRYQGPLAAGGRTLYLQTSPEFAMKRLLAAGSGSIYQICRVFRDGEAGRHHNPEFTLLEWYRLGFDLQALMDEVDALLTVLLDTPPAERVSYREAFLTHVGVDPFEDSVDALARCAADQGIDMASGLGRGPESRDAWLDLLLSHRLAPRLGHGRPVFLYDFPVSQAALARIDPGPPAVARRFEAFVAGIELANGYHELADADEQRARFAADRGYRQACGFADIEPDERLLAALGAGLPECAGVAVGLDRLVMLAAGADAITDVIAFPLSAL